MRGTDMRRLNFEECLDAGIVLLIGPPLLILLTPIWILAGLGWVCLKLEQLWRRK